eukprot:3648316-Lingulodinium_polyedra.AAC.1
MAKRARRAGAKAAPRAPKISKKAMGDVEQCLDRKLVNEDQEYLEKIIEWVEEHMDLAKKVYLSLEAGLLQGTQQGPVAEDPIPPSRT